MTMKDIFDLKPSPEAWVHRMLGHHSFDEIERILKEVGRSHIGQGATEKNPHYEFYKNAGAYLKSLEV